MALPKLINLAPRITFLTGDVNYTLIHFADASQLLICKTLKACADELPDFVRIHKAYIINPNYLEQITIVNNQKASVWIRGQTLPISKRRHKEVLMKLWSRQVDLWLGEAACLDLL